MSFIKGYIPGDRLVECDICGFTKRRSQLRKGVSSGQKGYYVCPDCFDGKHPLDENVKGRSEGKLEEIR